MGEAIQFFHTNGYANGFLKIHEETNQTLTNNHEDCSWYEEVIDDDLKWSFALKRVLHKGISDYQEIALLDTKRFGKVLVIDGKMQSAEVDEFIYHECLIHPALICHPEAKTVFIMGGGEGSAAREALKHKSLEKVVMCDIDQEVVDFCRRYLTVNQETFCHKKLNLVINDANVAREFSQNMDANEDLSPRFMDVNEDLSPGVMDANEDLSPRVGMEFDTLKDAWEFWLKYGRQMGFDVRKHYINKSKKDGKITSKGFVCAK